MKTLIIGTRGSPLALAQTELVTALLKQAHPALSIERRIVRTTGDRFGNLSLTQDGGKGLFTKEIEDLLLAGEIHLAIHSLKDLPTNLPAGLVVGATPPREDPRDVWIAKQARSVAELPPGAGVATSSLRRQAQLLARRPDIQIHEIRGNVGTRLTKLAQRDDIEALILAAAGLKRLGLYESRWPMLTVEEMIPAVGQGIIGCEIRDDDEWTKSLLSAINDQGTMACGMAERVFLRAVGGGCQLPYAGHAVIQDNQLTLVGAKFSVDGKQTWRGQASGPVTDSVAIGESVARQIMQ